MQKQSCEQQKVQQRPSATDIPAIGLAMYKDVFSTISVLQRFASKKT